MSRPLSLGLGLIFAALCWPFAVMGVAWVRGWRFSVHVVDEDELRKAGL
jgi:hypothetical protein